MRRILLIALLAACGKHGERVAAPARDTVPITITTSFPGASPAVIAESVTTPLERQLGQAAHIAALHSHSTEGRSVVVAEFASGTDVDVASEEVQKAITATAQLLPQDLPSPPTYTRAARTGAVMRMTVVGEVLPLEGLAQSAREIVAQKLAQVAGVGRVELCGPEDETRITVDPARLAASGKTIEDLRAAIASATPASAPLDSHTNPVPAYQDLPIIRDTARVVTDASFSSCVALKDNGARTVAVTVIPQVGTDLIAVRERLEAILPKLASELAAMRLDVWSRARPLAYQIRLDPEMSTQRRIEKLRHVLAELHLSTRALVQLGLPDQDPDVADLRVAPPPDHVDELEASLAAAFERQNLAILDRHDHIVGFSGADPAELRKQSAALVAALAAAKGLRVVEQLGGEDRPQPVVTLDRDRAATLGVTASEISTTLRVLAPGGMWVSTWFYPSGQQRVMLAVDGAFPDVLDQVMVRSTTGSLVPLSTVATVTETREPDAIFHEGQFPWIGVRIAGPLDALQNVLAKLPVPASVRRDVREPD